MTNSQDTALDIHARIEQAREEAHKIGEQYGKTSPEYAVAMDTLEELQAEGGHQNAVKPKSSLQQYCADNPDAQECLIYDS
jgi:hypothetical protein